MKYLPALLIASVRLILPCWANLPDNAADYAVWERGMLDSIAIQVGRPPEDSIPKLGKWIAQLSNGMNREPGDRPVFHAAQSALLSIPGHAEYYQNKIETMRAKVLEDSKKSPEEIVKMQDEGREVGDAWAYDSYCVDAFRILAQLPSPETVAVLGFYLNDPVGRDGKTLLGRNRTQPGDDFPPRPINSEGAAMAIRNLGIEHPPFKLPEGRERDGVKESEVDAWQAWWNEVKAGKRTYQFIGSAIDYGPDGPATKEQLARIEFDRKRSAAGHKKTHEAVAGHSGDAMEVAPLIAVLVLIVALGWHFLRKAKAGQP